MLAEPSAIDGGELFDRTAGNPFFVTEALAAETERVPTTIRDAVLARAARLGRPAQTMLEAAAVIPQRVEVWLLRVLAGGTLDGLGECLHSGMLTGDGDGVAFRHELARLAIADALTPARVVLLNQRALAGLAEPPAGARDLARLAHHAEAAGDGDAVLRFAPRAAEQAALLGAHREAEAQYARALRFAGGLAATQRAELLERLAAECYFTEMREEGLAALAEALDIHRHRGDVLKQGEIEQLRARMLRCVGRFDEARVAAEMAVSTLGPLPPGRELARAYSELAEISLHADEADATIAWGERAIALAERVGDSESLVLALNSTGTIQLGLGDRRGREKLLRSLALAKQAGLPTEVGRAYINLISAFSRTHNWREADELIPVGIEYCREHGLDAWLLYMLCAEAESDAAHGRWTEAAEVAGVVLDRPPSPVVGPRIMALWTLALVRLRRGDPGCWPLLDAALAEARAVGELQQLGPTAALRAEAAWLEGRVDAVAAETDVAYPLALALGQPSTLGELACWRWRAGLLTEAPAAAAEIYRLQIGGEWRLAAEHWHDCGCPYETALALGDSDDVGALRRALEGFRALGARPAAAIVTRRLRALERARASARPAGEDPEQPGRTHRPRARGASVPRRGAAQRSDR